MTAYYIDTELERTCAEFITSHKLAASLERLCSFHRDKGTHGLWQAVESIAEECAGLPYTTTTIRSYPADGALRYGTWLAPCPYDIVRGEVVLITGGEQHIPLVKQTETNFGIFSYSGAYRGNPTVVALEDLGKLEGSKPEQLKELIVFVQGPNLSSVRDLIVPRRVAGVLFAPSDANRCNDPVLRHARTWRRIPTTGKERYSDPTSIPFGVSLTPAQGLIVEEVLREAKATGKPATAQIDLDVRFQSGSFPVLEIVVQGPTPPKEYVVVCAHICHPGPSANDNASGVTAAGEIARLVADIFKRGGLRMTHRGLIVLLVPEVLGSMAWLLDQARPQYRLVAGINLDMLAADPELSGAITYLTRPPLTIRSALPWLAEHYLSRVEGLDRIIAKGEFGPAKPFNYQSAPFSLGSDHHVFGFPDFAVPMVSFGCWPDRFYHTDADVQSRLSILQLKRLTWVSACLALELLAENPKSGAMIIRSKAQRFLLERTTGALDAGELQRFHQEVATAKALYSSFQLSADKYWLELERLALSLPPPQQASPANRLKGPAGRIPQRLYLGPMSRTSVFETSGGQQTSNLERLVDENMIDKLNGLAQAEILIDGLKTLGEIAAECLRHGVAVDLKLLTDTMEQLAGWGLIHFIEE